MQWWILELNSKKTHMDLRHFQLIYEVKITNIVYIYFTTCIIQIIKIFCNIFYLKMTTYLINFFLNS